MAQEPTKIFVSYSHKDNPFLDEFERHLAPLVRAGEVHLTSDRLLRAGDVWDTVLSRFLEEADVVIFLVSADFLASDQALCELKNALQAHSTGVNRLVPIIVRPCDWAASPLATFQVLPRGGGSISTCPDRDAAWAEIVRELRTILRFRVEERAEPEPASLVPPQTIRPIEEIFTTETPDVTFVNPANFPRFLVYLRNLGQGLVVEGASGVGKTTVVRKGLAQLGVKDSLWLLGGNQDDRLELDQLLPEGFTGHLVIDDYHRLDRNRQVQIANAMKIISDRGRKKSKITVIGINPVGESLVAGLRDVAGRFQVFPMGRQPDEKVAELVQRGEKAANIMFRRRDEFIREAAGSFFTAQQLCFEAAVKAGVVETASESRVLVDVGFADIVSEVVLKLEKKYFADLRTFACHDQATPPRGATLALLWLLGQGTEGHVSIDDARYQFPEPTVREALDLLRSSFLADCFEASPGLRSLLYYNKNAGVLTIEDPQLTFYLRHMSWPALIEKTAHDRARINAEGKLVFAQPAEPKPRRAAIPEWVVLHLSDLHFDQLAQADLWSGQLAEDLREMACKRLDVLVISGDLTQQAGDKEFAAASRFLRNLTAEYPLTPAQLVVVPGNHDLSWKVAKSAYSLHRREDYSGPLDEGAYLAHGSDLIEVRDDKRHRERFGPFAGLCRQIKGRAPPLKAREQFEVQDFPREGLVFLGLNSAWTIDHHFPDRAAICPEAVAEALRQLRNNRDLAGRLKIAVWHHPVSSPDQDRIRDRGVLEQLAKAGFRLVLHGHIHSAEASVYRYDQTPGGRRLDFLAAGTFGAPVREWVPGYPLQYNLLRISKERVVVETRRREEPNGAWKPDARWLQGPGKDPAPRYEIPLTSPEH